MNKETQKQPKAPQVRYLVRQQRYMLIANWLKRGLVEGWDTECSPGIDPASRYSMEHGVAQSPSSEAKTLCTSKTIFDSKPKFLGRFAKDCLQVQKFFNLGLIFKPRLERSLFHLVRLDLGLEDRVASCPSWWGNSYRTIAIYVWNSQPWHLILLPGVMAQFHRLGLLSGR